MSRSTPKRVLIAAFKHETNTFSVLPTDLNAYKARGYYRDDEVPQKMRGTATEMGAAFAAADRHGWSLCHPLYANAVPSGKVTKDMHDHVTEVLVTAIKEQGPFDGIYLCLHGAMACDHDQDGEGRLLQSLRDVVGPDLPIAVTLDLHANVTDRMADLCDIMVSYRTYPHIDQFEITTQACDLLQRTMDGEIHPTVQVRRGDMLDGADFGRTTEPGPMTEALAELDKLLAATPGTYSGSINSGFPWADTYDSGPTCVVVGEGKNPAYGEIADKIIAQLWEDRHRLTITTYTVAETMAQVKDTLAQGVDGPIVLNDFADNPGGGGYADATRLLAGMIDAGLTDAAFSVLCDPEAAAACHAAGIGATIDLAIGGKVDATVQGGPLTLSGKVTNLTDGKFQIEGPMTRGLHIDMGPTAVFTVGGVDIVISSRRFQNYDQMYFKSVGIDPLKKKVLAVKSAHHFRAAYAPIASKIIVVDDGGGLTSCNFKDLPFKNVRRPNYPLDLD